jgi:NADPH:quinone reductase-like Zn-dependent oxidoreductase
MKALQISRFGSPDEVVQLADVPEPGAPGPSEVLVAPEYAPINHSEILRIEGRYPLLPTFFPAIAGNEAVARILSVGSGVQGLKPGDRVLVPTEHATWREQLVLSAVGLFPLPPRADRQQLSMVSINPPTAALLLSEFVELKRGDWVLQNVGNSGVGRSVIAFASHLGLRTVSIVRRAELVSELRGLGADVVLVDGPDVRARVAEATSAAPIRLAIDGVSGQSTATLSGCLAPGGAVVLYSILSGHSGVADGIDLIFRDIAIRGFWLYSAQYRGSPRAADAMKLGAQLVAEDKLHFPIAGIYPLTAAREALRHALKGGKVLFEIAA